MQPGSWASALKNNLQPGPGPEQNTQGTGHADLASAQDHPILGAEATKGREVTQPAVVDPNPKAAARQKLLTEALKSRANAVTGERHCLGCGRGFHDLSRFAQHILDKHGGINSSEPIAAASSYQNIKTGGDDNSFPSLGRTEGKPLHLADIAVIKRKSDVATKEPQNKKLNKATITPAAANAATRTAAAQQQQQLRRKPDPTAFQAPEGTHAKRKKRPSRLKRIYRRTKAEGLVEHWLSVLSAVEEALQTVGELHGALSNELHIIEQKEKTLFSEAQEAAQNRGTTNLNFAQALVAGRPQSKNPNGDCISAVFTPSVQLQLLQEQVRATFERVEQLGSIHDTARANLVKSQEQLLATQGGGGGGKGKAKVVDSVELSDINIEKKSSVVVGVVAGKGGDEEKEKKAILVTQEEAPPPPVQIPTASLPSADVVDKNGDTNTASITTTVSSTSSDSSCTSSSTSNDSNSSTSDSASSSSDGDFGLQWGDTLRAWATHVGVDAQKSLQQQKHQKEKKQPKKEAKSIESRREMPRVVAEPARKLETPIIENVNVELPLKNDNKMAEPVLIPAHAHAADTTSPPAEAATAAPPIAADAVRTWLEGTEEVDATTEYQIEILSTSFSDTGPIDNDEVGLNKLQFQAVTEGAAVALSSSPFHCTVCNITASGLKPWQDHLSSRRHASKLAQTANNPTKQQQQKQKSRLLEDATAVPISVRPTLASKCYTGPNADVEPYVTHTISPELNEATTALLKQLLEWQERTRRLDPVNFKRKRRLVSGMREVEKFVKMNKAKLLIVAPNIGPVPTNTSSSAASTPPADDDNTKNKNEHQSGLEASSVAEATTTGVEPLLAYPIQAALDMAKERNIPTVFALTRQRMGKILGARKTASAFVVLDASGAEHLLAQVIDSATAGRRS